MTVGKVAIITGAGTGIGKHTALALLDEGYSVALAGRRVELLEAVVDESGAEGRVIAVPTDVGDAQAVERLFQQLVDMVATIGLAASLPKIVILNHLFA